MSDPQPAPAGTDAGGRFGVLVDNDLAPVPAPLMPLLRLAERR